MTTKKTTKKKTRTKTSKKAAAPGKPAAPKGEKLSGVKATMDLAKKVWTHLSRELGLDPANLDQAGREKLETKIRDVLVLTPPDFARVMAGDKLPPAAVIARMKGVLKGTPDEVMEEKAKPAAAVPIKDPKEADPKRYAHLMEIAEMTQHPGWARVVASLNKKRAALSKKCEDPDTKGIKVIQGELRGLKELWETVLQPITEMAEMTLFNKSLEIKVDEKKMTVTVKALG